MINNKRVVSLIPVKLNSERVRDKNIRPFFDGKPLIRFISDIVLECKYFDEIYVYCSSEKIKNYIPEQIMFLKRPEFLDGNSCNCNDIIREFMKVIDSDIYSVNHATAPFTASKSIDKCVEAVAGENAFDSAFIVRKIQTFLWSKNGPVNFDPQHFPRTQDLEPIYMETSGAHVFTREVFRKYNCRYGVSPYYVEATEIEGIDIDTEEDMTIAQSIYRSIK